MGLAGVRSWFGGGAEAPRPPPAAAASPPPAPAPRQAAPALWSPARIGAVEHLWTEGFLSPGGAEEVLRLARPLGLSGASSLMLLGAGSGGPGRSLATELGCWVSGFESDPDLARLAAERIQRAGLAKRAPVEPWDPEAPVFRSAYFHHALALEPLRGAPPLPVLTALAGALKPGGQLVLVETVATAPVDPADPVLGAWARLQGRPTTLPSEAEITRALIRLGFDVRIAEDVSPRQGQLALQGWRDAVGLMARDRPPPAVAAQLVGEAELWLRRLRLVQDGRLRLMRWHALFAGSRPPLS